MVRLTNYFWKHSIASEWKVRYCRNILLYQEFVVKFYRNLSHRDFFFCKKTKTQYIYEVCLHKIPIFVGYIGRELVVEKQKQKQNSSIVNTDSVDAKKQACFAEYDNRP